MPSGKNSVKNSKSNKKSKKKLDESISLEEIIIINESYCMACDSPLRTYSSLICPECLEESADLLSTIASLEEIDSISKTIFIDPDYCCLQSEDDIEAQEQEVLEEEDLLIEKELPHDKKVKLQLNLLIEDLKSQD